jgi:tetratricopeptide (TPR) repeat protein/tRNA A-37 threonylcarbamoyl transferase component Bud32
VCGGAGESVEEDDRAALPWPADDLPPPPLVAAARPVASQGPRPATWPTLADYEIIEYLDKGGMGAVYKARQRSLNRIVALKLLSRERQDDPALRARHPIEAEAVARLNHPNIAQIYEVGEENGQPFLALEYATGGSLDRKLARKPLPASEAAGLAETVARAIHFAHEQGIIHRDLKPANVLLMADGTVKLTDFGLAKRVEDPAGPTPPGAILGTPSYMPPESAVGKSKEVGPAADTYSCGAILYELLTGRPPFIAETILETLYQVRHQELVPPSRLQPKVPRDLESICLKCLEKEPKRRYPSALALAEDLRRFLEGKPTLARPASVGRRVMKWARREPARAALAALSVLVLLGLLGGGSWYAARERRQAEEARAAERQVRQLLADSYAFTAQLAMRRGDWQTALEYLDRALADNHRDPVGLRLEKVRAWCAVGEVPLAVAELETLAQNENLTPQQRGLVLLWQGDFSLSRSYLHADQALQLFKQALKDLPTAEASYAQALLAKTTPKAVKHLEEALRSDPFHPRARALLGFLLLGLGELSRARDHVVFGEHLFADDPTYKLLHASILALENKQEEVRALLDRADPSWTKPHRANARLWVEILPQLRDVAAGIVEPDPLPFKQMSVFAKLMMKLPEGMSGKPVPNTSALFLPFPPALVRGYLRIAKLAPLLLLGVDRDVRRIKEVGDIVAAHHQGLLFMLYGQILVKNDRWSDAETAFLMAAQAPSVVPVRPAALFYACACEATLAKKAPPREAADLRARALRNAEERVLLGGIRLFEAERLSRYALDLKDLDLARAIIRQWRRQAPKDIVLLRRQVELELLSGAYGRVLELTDKTKDKDMLGYRSRAIEQIRQQALKPGIR